MPPQMVLQRLVAQVESSSLWAVPFFITAGAVLNYAGVTKRLMNLCEGIVGHLPGALGQVNVLLSALMGGISGSAASDAATECKILVPEMLERGYDKDFSAAVTAASSGWITPGSSRPASGSSSSPLSRTCRWEGCSWPDGSRGSS